MKVERVIVTVPVALALGIGLAAAPAGVYAAPPAAVHSSTGVDSGSGRAGRC